MISHLAFVLFRHHGQRYAIEAQYVLRQGQLNPLDAESLTCFSDLLPLTAQPADSGEAQWLEIASRSTPPWRLGLEAPAELIELSVADIFPLPEILYSRRTFAALQAVALYQHELVALLNADVLFQLQQSWHSKPR